MALKGMAGIPASSYGFAFWWGWIFLLIFNPAAADGVGGPRAVWVVSMLSTALGFAALYGLSAMPRKTLWAAPVRWGAAAAMALATFFLASTLVMPSAGEWATLVGAALGGAALAYFALPWACQLASLKAQQSQVVLFLSFLAAVVLYFLLSCVPNLARMGVLVGFPVALALMAGFLPVVRGSQEAFEPALWKHRDRSLFVRLSVMAAVSSFMFCIFRELLPTQSGSDALASTDIVFALSGLLGVLLLVMSLVMREGIGFSLLFKVALPLVVLGALVFSVLDRDDSVLAIASIMTGTRCASLLFWASFVALAARNRSKGDVVFCGGFGASYIGGAAGAACGIILRQLHLAGALSLTTLSIVVVLVMVVAVGWLVGMPGSSRGSAMPTGKREIPEVRKTLDLDAVVEEGGLTRREAEILAILAQGRTLPYVAEKLYIAPTTVQTHVKHIYKKLGVHNRQELLDYLDASIE